MVISGKYRFFFKFAVLVVVLVLAYGIWVEPGRLAVNQETWRSVKGLGIKFVLLSDLHIPSNRFDLNKILAALERERPDYIFVAGDTRKHGQTTEASHRFFSRMAAFGRVIVVLGDKDLCGRAGQCLYCYHNYVTRSIDDLPYTLLRNSFVLDSAKNIAVYGVDDPVSNSDKMGFTESVDISRLNILLVHSTHKLKREEMKRFDIVLAGNTHGGQIFFLKPFLKYYKDSFDTRFTGGSYVIDKTHLLVSKGVGTSYLPIRLGVSPEMSVITVKRPF